MGFEKLIDVLLEFIDLFRFWQVVDQYEEGVVLRLGKYNRTLGPGIHWMLPLALERAMLDTVTVRTTAMSSLDLTTYEDQALRLDCIVRWKIKDIYKVLLETEGVDDVLKDATYATISKVVRAHTWADIIKPDFSDTLTKEARKRAFRYGVEIEAVEFGDLVRPIHLALLS